MSAPDPEPANGLQRDSQPTAQAILRSQTKPAKYCYVGVRCKPCLGEGRTTWLLLKYLGPDEGKAQYKLVLPPAPRMATFNMHCDACDFNDTYSRNDAQTVSLEQAPAPDFVNQY